MRSKKLHRKLLHLKETAKRRRLTSGERAIATFIERYVADEDVAFSGSLPEKSPHSAAEDEDEAGNRLVCTACGEDEHEDDSKRCRMCGAPLKSVADEDERRTGEDERSYIAPTRVNDDDEENTLGQGQPRWRGIDTPKHSERSGRADEAAAIFRSQYRRTREASRGIQRGDFRTGF